MLTGSFRLILRNICDEAKYISDANKEVEWEDVASVEWCIEKEDCCPLCLMSFTAPRVSSCGHCFCFACVKQYLTLQPDSWVKCPVCSVLFDEHSLRPVRIFKIGREIKAGDVLSMDLVVRDHSSINAFSINNPHLHHYLKYPIPNADAPESDTKYCHLLLNTPYYELSTLQENLHELDQCEREMNLVGEVYLFNSMRLVREDITMRIETIQACHGKHIRRDCVYSNLSNESLLDTVYYYYTLPWRLSYHLLPLCFQCLRSYYGNYQHCPSQIQSKILEVEDIEVTSHVCSVDKVLQHSPLHSVIHYVELDVRSLVPDRIEKGLWEMVKKREANRKLEYRQMKKEERRMDVGFDDDYELEESEKGRNPIL